jgi:multidrug efflux pump subunit AcrA (membrane-fusion protein)
MKNTYIYCIAAMAILTVSSCGNKGPKQDAAPPATPVNVITAEKAEALYYDKYQGTVTALNSVELRSPG